jgi:Domain of unknown function (DUF6438)
MWFKGGRSMGPSAVVGVIALIAIEYAANGGQLTALPPPPDPTFHVRLERGACFGPCLSYSVEVDAAGNVRFLGASGDGGTGVPCQGERRWNIRPSAVAALQAEVDASGFFGFREAYRSAVTDQRASTVTVTRYGKTKTVVDDVGLSVGMPHAMVDLENAIDAAARDGPCVARPHGG